MGYRLDNKDVDLTGKRLTKIDSGASGYIYRYKNSALKMFKPGREIPLDEETARFLTTISTNRILLPRNLLFYNNAFNRDRIQAFQIWKVSGKVYIDFQLNI